MRRLPILLLLLGLPALALAQPINPLTNVFYIAADGKCLDDPCTSATRRMCRNSTTDLRMHVCDPVAGFYKLSSEKSRLQEVCAQGCRFTTICGATCSSPTSTCVAGSAIKAIADAADFSPATPYTMIVWPGRYAECVVINAITDLTVYLMPGVQIVPVVTAPADVDGGVVRIASGTSGNAAERITIVSDAYVRNDGYGAPEAALMIGQQAAQTTPRWDDVTVIGGTWIGAHDAIHITGDSSSSNTEVGIPKATLREVTMIGGADSFTRKAAMDVTLIEPHIKSISNYCEASDASCTAAGVPHGCCTGAGTGTCTTMLAAVSGDVDATGASTNSFTLGTAGAGTASTVTDAYVGRHGRLTAGTCAAGIDFWVRDFTSAKLVTVTNQINSECTGSGVPAPCCTGSGTGTCVGLTVTPDATCDYAIDAVAKAAEAPCTEIDWTMIRAQEASFGFWKATGIHFGILGQSTAPDLDFTKSYGGDVEVQVNDFGPLPGSSLCTGQQEIAGILGYTGTTTKFQRLIVDGTDILVRNNVVLRSSGPQADNLCPYPLAGLSFPGGIFEDYASFTGNIRVENTVDAAATSYGIAAAWTAASTLRVPRAHIEVSNTAPAYAGTTKTLIQAGSAVLSVGDITSNAAITTTGTITHLDSTDNPTKTISAALLAPVAADDPILTKLTQGGITVSAITCLVDPADAAESVVVTVNECDSTADNCAGLDGATTITCDNDGASDDGSLSNPTLDVNDYISLTIGTVTGTVGRLVVVLTYTENAQ